MKVIQLSPTDSYSRNSVYSVLNHSHDKRIRQVTLDFYRNGFTHFLSRNGIIIWLIGLDDNNNKVGISGCAFGCKSKQVIHSITTVHPEFRNLGHGKELMHAKLQILRETYPRASYRSFVNINNEYSIKMCSGVGLTISDEGKRERDGKDPTSFVRGRERKSPRPEVRGEIRALSAQ